MSNWILYYSHNSLPIELELYFQEELAKAKGNSNICAVVKTNRTDKKFGDLNIVCNNKGCKKNNWVSILSQMNTGIEAILEEDTEAVVFLAEHDVLYPKGYFDLNIEDEQIIFKNMNWFFATSRGYLPGNSFIHSQTIAKAKLFKYCIGETPYIENSLWFKNENSGIYRLEKINYESPSLDIRWGKNYTGDRGIGKESSQFLQEVPYWGSHADIFKEITARI